MDPLDGTGEFVRAQEDPCIFKHSLILILVFIFQHFFNKSLCSSELPTKANQSPVLCINRITKSKDKRRPPMDEQSGGFVKLEHSGLTHKVCLFV